VEKLSLEPTNEEGDRMGIRPVDMQVVVHKVQEVHSAKQSVVSKQENELLQTQNANKENAVEQHHTVANTEEARHNAINADRDGQNGGYKPPDKKKQEDDEDAEEKKEAKRVIGDAGRHFDMKV
jgi:hypothetical protein